MYSPCLTRVNPAISPHHNEVSSTDMFAMIAILDCIARCVQSACSIWAVQAFCRFDRHKTHQPLGRIGHVRDAVKMGAGEFSICMARSACIVHVSRRSFMHVRIFKLYPFWISWGVVRTRRLTATTPRPAAAIWFWFCIVRTFFLFCPVHPTRDFLTWLQIMLNCMQNAWNARDK